MRIAIFTLGSRGDVQPYVALAKAAISKGHSAVICTGKSFKYFIEGNGVEFEVIVENDVEYLYANITYKIIKYNTYYTSKIKVGEVSHE